MSRPLYKIGLEITKDWTNGKSNWRAMPYVKAMLELNSIESDYYSDSARSIVIYFLSNSNTWRGEAAKRIKKELREMLK